MTPQHDANPKTHPISFSPAMITALVDGRKSVTRRIVKPQSMFEGLDAIIKRFPNQQGCPYGTTGTLCWVREAWRMNRDYDALNALQISISSGDQRIDYTSTSSNPEWVGRRRHARYMPRWASRLTLELKSVRVEHLQDITAIDAMAEGIEVPVPPGALLENQKFPEDFGEWPEQKQKQWFRDTARATYIAQCVHADSLVKAYRELWESLHGEGSWGRNEFVWVLEFTLHRQNIDTLLKERAAT